MDYGKVAVLSDSFVVFYGTGNAYSVAPKSVDPYGKYDYNDVAQYVADHPSMAVAESDYRARESLENELASLNEWLSAHDYIGTKIATGRATIADYAEEIALMNQYAERINEINAILNPQIATEELG